MAVDSKRCLACGALNPGVLQACSICGQTLVPLHSAAPIALANQSLPVPNPRHLSNACPVCASEAIQKVSGVYATQSQVSHSSGTQASVGYIDHVGATASAGPTASRTKTTTVLAARLAPPPRPRYIDEVDPVPFAVAGMTLFGLVFIATAISSLAHFSSGEETGFGILALVVVVAFTTLAALVTHRLRGDVVYMKRLANTVRRQKWESDSRIWETLFYCAKCDHVHAAATRKSVPSDRIAELYQPRT